MAADPTPKIVLTQENLIAIKGILDLCSSDSKFAHDAYEAITGLGKAVEPEDVIAPPIVEPEPPPEE